jgi:diphthamide biosynthesis protein 2
MCQLLTQAGNDDGNDDEDRDPDQPTFSLITGKYRYARRFGGEDANNIDPGHL